MIFSTNKKLVFQNKFVFYSVLWVKFWTWFPSLYNGLYEILQKQNISLCQHTHLNCNTYYSIHGYHNTSRYGPTITCEEFWHQFIINFTPFYCVYERVTIVVFCHVYLINLFKEARCGSWVLMCGSVVFVSGFHNPRRTLFAIFQNICVSCSLFLTNWTKQSTKHVLVFW